MLLILETILTRICGTGSPPHTQPTYTLLEIIMKNYILLFAAILSFSAVPVFAGDADTTNAAKHTYPSLGLTQGQIIRHLETYFKFGPPQLKPNGLVVLSAENAESRTILAITKAGGSVVMASVYFQPTAAYNDSTMNQIINRTAILIRFLKNTAPEILWDGPEESRAMGKIIGELSRQSGQHRRIVGSRVVIFRRTTMERSLIELHVHSKELQSQ